MKYFTSENNMPCMNPSEKTLAIIRQIAYTYRVIKINGQNRAFCLN